MRSKKVKKKKSIKIMIVGESGVGKTSLREAYLEGGALDRKDSFAQQMATPMTDSREKSITIEEDDF